MGRPEPAGGAPEAFRTHGSESAERGGVTVQQHLQSDHRRLPTPAQATRSATRPSAQACRSAASLPTYDEIIGLDLTHPRRRHFSGQLTGNVGAASILRAGLAPFRTLPAPEATTETRTRMAAEIARAVAANGNVTRQELLDAGFTEGQLARHFPDALRAARVTAMAA